ncbi:acyl-CoA thioesterase [Aurantiacibacter rhizosphaerae]|uniref:Acyl-CoA thioesterase n=1 Tax=Aurantiacibacter rhizosphaerae TaxID=2691582 RepID=A0A844XBJ8_9SPHN|nr:thioesterase family protein [Aurantiacibacter rhizosphaerae]MWV26885.1 acyl-CoA thioesterase [Aurantiacibacter rhizosphaerae]
MNSCFETTTRVRFAHVDGASIVFYPRYFEMLNAAVEDWFEQELHADFKSMHVTRGIGVPTIQLETQFLAPSIMGDLLTVRITPVKIGRSSCTYEAVFLCGEEVRLKAKATLVCMDLKAQKSVPWPDDIRARMMGETVAS